MKLNCNEYCTRNNIRSRFIGNIFVLNDENILNESSSCCHTGNTTINTISWIIPNFIKQFHLSIGPHWYGTVITYIVIFSAFHIYYQVLNDVYSSHHVSYIFYIFLYIIQMIDIILICLFLFLTALGDPGIIRQSYIPFNDLEADDLSLYCEICDIYLNPRAKVNHCPDCNVCIEHLDHHCIWMSKCIGKKNMKYFICFNVCSSIGIVLLLYITFLL